MIRRLKWWILGVVLVILAGLGGLFAIVFLQAGPNDLIPPSEAASGLHIPRTFDDAAMASIELPLARPEASPVPLTSTYYYGIWTRPIYKSYPIYAVDREPSGYIDWLKQQEPQIAFDETKLKTPEDWIKAGELVFEAPTAYGHIVGFGSDLYVRDPEWLRRVNPPLLKDGVMPGVRYFIRKKGNIEIGMLSCATCHTRVLPDGTLLKGAQGNFPADRAIAWDYEHYPGLFGKYLAGAVERVLYGAPWLGAFDPAGDVSKMSATELAGKHWAIPPGVMARHGTNPTRPARTPDLIGVKDRKYLDATGLVRHRDIGDLMRYAAMNQDTDLASKYLGKSPGESLFVIGAAPKDPAKFGGRYSDAQLYALAQYLYSLQPPSNPNAFNDDAKAGQKIFEREGCDDCHTPPIYTNNKLTLALGFTPPADHLERYDIVPLSVGTDPDSALKARRATGYYKVPSLKGVWYRGPFEHNGSVMTLEDWFDPQRLRDEYVPTGFKGYNVEHRAVQGHEYGLDLAPEEKRLLIAFLKTL